MPELSDVHRISTIMGDLDLIRVVDVDYIKDYTMDLKFSNGEYAVLTFCHY